MWIVFYSCNVNVLNTYFVGQFLEKFITLLWQWFITYSLNEGPIRSIVWKLLCPFTHTYMMNTVLSLHFLPCLESEKKTLQLPWEETSLTKISRSFCQAQVPWHGSYIFCLIWIDADDSMLSMKLRRMVMVREVDAVHKASILKACKTNILYSYSHLKKNFWINPKAS